MVFLRGVEADGTSVQYTRDLNSVGVPLDDAMRID